MVRSSQHLARLERAREALEAGRLNDALSLLPPRSSLPAPLRLERDLVEAEALRGEGFFARAEAIYRALLAAARGDPALWLEAALGSASGLRSVGRAAEAAALLGRARAVARASGAGWSLERLRLEQAMVLRAEGRWRPALRELRLLLERARRERDWPQASFLCWAVAGALRLCGDLSGSRAAFERSRSWARRAGEAGAEGYAILGLGGVTRIQGRLRQSRAFYAAALRAFARTDDRFAQAYAHCGLANSLRQLGLRREAERRYRQARALYASLGDPVDLAYVDWGIGKLRLDEGRAAEALIPIRRALAAFQRGRERRGECLCELALAQAMHALGRTAQAERLFARGVRRGRAARLHSHLEIYT